MIEAFSTGTERQTAVGLLALLVLSLYALGMAVRWLITGTTRPEPWDENTAEKLQDPQTTLLCHRCLIPNEPGADFCENCGAPIGQYTNYLPFPSLFSLGHVLRIGTDGEFKRSPATVVGYVLLALAEYTIFAPVYLFQFFRRLHQCKVAGK